MNSTTINEVSRLRHDDNFVRMIDISGLKFDKNVEYYNTDTDCTIELGLYQDRGGVKRVPALVFADAISNEISKYAKRYSGIMTLPEVVKALEKREKMVSAMINSADGFSFSSLIPLVMSGGLMSGGGKSTTLLFVTNDPDVNVNDRVLKVVLNVAKVAPIKDVLENPEVMQSVMKLFNSEGSSSSKKNIHLNTF